MELHPKKWVPSLGAKVFDAKVLINRLIKQQDPCNCVSAVTSKS